MTAESLTRIRISRAVLCHLDGSGLFQNQGYSSDPEQEAAAQSLLTKVLAAKTRKDHSIQIEMDLAEATVLYSYAEPMMIGAGQNLGYVDEDKSALAEYNSSRALMLKLVAAFGNQITSWWLS